MNSWTSSTENSPSMNYVEPLISIAAPTTIIYAAKINTLTSKTAMLGLIPSYIKYITTLENMALKESPLLSRKRPAKL